MKAATLTVTQAAEKLGIGRNQAYNAVRDGQLPVVKIGKRILVPSDALDTYLKSRSPMAPPPEPPSERSRTLKQIAKKLIETAADEHLRQIINMLLTADDKRSEDEE